MKEDLSLYTGQVTPGNIVTARVFRSIYVGINGMGSSMNSLGQLISLMRHHQVVVGQNCKSVKTISKIAISMSDTMHGKLLHHIKNTRDPTVILIDGSNDKGKYNFFYCFILQFSSPFEYIIFAKTYSLQNL